VLLYYITDRTQFAGSEDFRCRALLHKIGEAAACGVDFIQLREKDLSARALESLSAAALRLIAAKSSRTRLLINSRTDIAIACGADGVHLRSDDISASDVRKAWSGGAGGLAHGKPVICVSCHTAAEVCRATAEGADFAVFAPVFEKKNNPDVAAAGLTVLREACRANIRVLALGGITLQNARSCIEAGAAGIAAIRLFQEHDITTVARLLKT